MRIAGSSDPLFQVELQIAVAEGDICQNLPNRLPAMATSEIGINDDAGAVDNPLQA